MMRLLARVILTPAAERGVGMVRKAAELAKKHGWFLASQFENPANPAYHRQTTGPEILSDFADRRLDFFVTGWGTGGTLTGAGEVIKLARPETRVIAAEPAVAALLAGAPFASHKIQGWTPDFVPGVLNRKVPDSLVTVTDQEAIDASRALARSEASLRHFERCHVRGGQGRGGRAARQRAARDAPRHGGTLPVDAALRGNSRGQRSGAMSARRYAPLPDPFAMHLGGTLKGARVAFETWGSLAPAKDNAILVFTGLSPPAHAARSPADPSPGWWDAMIGPGLALDTDRWFVIVVNSLGSCFGSTGPASDNPATGERYRLDFPELAIEDIASGGHAVLRSLGIERAIRSSGHRSEAWSCSLSRSAFRAPPAGSSA